MYKRELIILRFFCGNVCWLVSLEWVFIQSWEDSVMHWAFLNCEKLVVL